MIKFILALLHSLPRCCNNTHLLNLLEILLIVEWHFCLVLIARDVTGLDQEPFSSLGRSRGISP